MYGATCQEVYVAVCIKHQWPHPHLYTSGTCAQAHTRMTEKEVGDEEIEEEEGQEEVEGWEGGGQEEERGRGGEGLGG